MRTVTYIGDELAVTIANVASFTPGVAVADIDDDVARGLPSATWIVEPPFSDEPADPAAGEDLATDPTATTAKPKGKGRSKANPEGDDV